MTLGLARLRGRLLQFSPQLVEHGPRREAGDVKHTFSFGQLFAKH